jgi:hypothetical protein
MTNHYLEPSLSHYPVFYAKIPFTAIHLNLLTRHNGRIELVKRILRTDDLPEATHSTRQPLP